MFWTQRDRFHTNKAAHTSHKFLFFIEYWAMEGLQRHRNVRRILQLVQMNRALRRERHMRDHANPFESFSDEEFFNRFRFHKQTTVFIIELINDDIDPETERGSSLPGYLQVLITLRFFATGSFQITVGDLSGVHQSTVCRTLKRVSHALARQKARFIHMPRGERFRTVMEGFHEIANIPGVIGAIDGTHIKIANPGGPDALRFINRKGWYSINCQFICTSDLCFTNIVARWAGSTHDSRIFSESNIARQFANGEQHGILLGDAGYPCLSYLLTPVARANTPQEERYNYAHSRTRTVIERAFGILKRRFACLHNIGLRFKNLRTIFAAIIATAILHNIAMMRGAPDVPDGMAQPNVQDQNDPPPRNVINDRRAGILARQRIIRLL